ALVHRLKSHAARLDIGRDRVDDSVAPGNSAGERASVAHVGAEEREPFHACRTERASRLAGMPDYDAHSRSFGSEAPHETLAEEPRATKHADRGHRTCSSCWIREVVRVIMRHSTEHVVRGGQHSVLKDKGPQSFFLVLVRRGVSPRAFTMQSAT